MRPDFTAQPMRMLARALAADPLWVLECLNFQRSGRLSRPLADYNGRVLSALWGDDLKAALQQAEIRRQSEMVDDDEPFYTGDPVIDDLERRIAAGEDVDFSSILGKGGDK